MPMQSPSGQSPPSLIRRAVPPFFGWQSYPRVVANLFVFAGAALSCEWLVHQVQYLIEYGSRFNTVMASNPHRLYMAPAGMLLGIIAGGATILLLGSLIHAGRTRKALLSRLPRRLHRFIPAQSPPLSWSAVLLTGYGLLVIQTALYFGQENVESATVTGAWPGLWVFLAPAHLTVIPLHLIAATSCSLILWMVCLLLRHSRNTIRVTSMLVAMMAGRGGTPAPLIPHRSLIPNLRPRAGEFGLRSPPLGSGD